MHVCTVAVDQVLAALPLMAALTELNQESPTCIMHAPMQPLGPALHKLMSELMIALC